MKKQQLEKKYKFYGDEAILKTAPKVKGKYILELFKVGKYVSDDELEKEYSIRGLIPSDIESIYDYDLDEAILEDEAILDKKYYIGTHWKDADDKWCYASFDRCYDERYVFVDRSDRDWGGVWWFAGLRKSDLKTLNPQKSLEPLALNFESALKMMKEAGYVVYKQM